MDCLTVTFLVLEEQVYFEAVKLLLFLVFLAQFYPVYEEKKVIELLDDDENLSQLKLQLNYWCCLMFQILVSAAVNGKLQVAPTAL